MGSQTFLEWLDHINISPGHIKDTVREVGFLAAQIAPELEIGAGPDLEGYLLYWRTAGKGYLELTVKPNTDLEYFYSKNDLSEGGPVYDLETFLLQFLPLLLN